MSKIKYYLYGDNQHILMFSYPLYLEQLNEFYEKVDDPNNADVVFISYSQDIAWNKFPAFYKFQKKLNAKIILLCEEPMWDLSWSGNIRKKEGKTYATQHKSRTKVQIYHLGYTDTEIFEYDKIPHFLTTSDVYFKNYLTYIDKIKNTDITKICMAKKYDVGGIYARRFDPTDNEFYVGDDVNNKCLHFFKNDLADSLKNNNDLTCDFFGDNNSTYEGLTDITIYDSLDFHAAKLEWSFLNTKFLFALENTMTKSYVTEKIFDAVASLSIPIYCLPPTEDIKFKGINLYDLLSSDYETLFNELVKQINEFDVEPILKENLEILEKHYLNEYEQNVKQEISNRIIKLNENVNRILNGDMNKQQNINFTNKLGVFFLTTSKEYHTGTLKIAIETFLKKCKSQYSFDLLVYFDKDDMDSDGLYSFVDSLETKYDNLNKCIIVFNKIAENENFYDMNMRDINLDEFSMGASHGVNCHFYMTLSDLFTRSYDNFLLLESDTMPLKDDWFDVAYNFIDSESYQPFYIAGSTYKGKHRDEILKQYWGGHLNGVAIYKNCKELKFSLNESKMYLIKLLKENPKKYENFMNYDVANYLYFKHVELDNLLVDTNFISNISDQQNKDYKIEDLLKEFPETRIIHRKDLY